MPFLPGRRRAQGVVVALDDHVAHEAQEGARPPAEPARERPVAGGADVGRAAAGGLEALVLDVVEAQRLVAGGDLDGTGPAEERTAGVDGAGLLLAGHEPGGGGRPAVPPNLGQVQERRPLALALLARLEELAPERERPRLDPRVRSPPQAPPVDVDRGEEAVAADARARRGPWARGRDPGPRGRPARRPARTSRRGRATGPASGRAAPPPSSPRGRRSSGRRRRRPPPGTRPRGRSPRGRARPSRGWVRSSRRRRHARRSRSSRAR